MGFSQQVYWSGLPFPPPGNPPIPGIKPTSPASPELQLFTAEPLGKELPYDPAIPFLGIYPKKAKTLVQKRYRHFYVHSSIIYNSQDMEAT